MRIQLALAVLAMALLTTGAQAQSQVTEHTVRSDEDASRPPASIEDVEWMAGDWIGEAFGGTAEEVWSPPSAGTMLGMYKLHRDDQVVFYEILTIQEENDSLVLKLKHFHPDLKGWEEKDDTVDFPLVKLEEKKAWFRGLTFHRISDDRLMIYLALRQGDEPPREVVFDMKKRGD